jgi:hypothetical protein
MAIMKRTKNIGVCFICVNTNFNFSSTIDRENINCMFSFRRH